MTVLTNGMAVYPPRLYDLVREQEQQIEDLKETLERSRRYGRHWLRVATDNLDIGLVSKAEADWMREEVLLYG